MTRYTIDEEWGGGEVETVATSFDLPAGYMAVRRPGRSFILVHAWELTEIKPPIPPEPEPGAYLINGVLCVRFAGDITTRCWSVATEGVIGGYVDHRWEDAVDALGGPGVTIQRLVPAPPEVELPWGVGDDRVNVGGPTAPGVHYAGRWISADLAEAKAYALLAAARAAREAS